MAVIWLSGCVCASSIFRTELVLKRRQLPAGYNRLGYNKNMSRKGTLHTE